jgi:uncharacterized OsmC-like protein
MVLTMAAVAEHKGIPVTRLAAAVKGQTEFVGRRTKTHFVSELDLGEGLDPREVRILFNSARQCEVHKMLQGEFSFEERWVGAPENQAKE